MVWSGEIVEREGRWHPNPRLLLWYIMCVDMHRGQRLYSNAATAALIVVTTSMFPPHVAADYKVSYFFFTRTKQLKQSLIDYVICSHC